MLLGVYQAIAEIWLCNGVPAGRQVASRTSLAYSPGPPLWGHSIPLLFLLRPLSLDAENTFCYKIKISSPGLGTAL